MLPTGQRGIGESARTTDASTSSINAHAPTPPGLVLKLLAHAADGFDTDEDREDRRMGMRVLAFAPSLSVVSLDTGGITAEGLPMKRCYVDRFPTQITVPVVVAVCSPRGTNYDARKVIVATSPDGERVGTLEFSWDWPDDPPLAVKFRVFAQHLSMTVTTAGIYAVGLYDSLHRTETDYMFPLPVLEGNPPVPKLAKPSSEALQAAHRRSPDGSRARPTQSKRSTAKEADLK